MLRLLFFLLFVVAIVIGMKFASLGRAGDVFYSICDLTEDHFFRNDQKLKKWLEKCHAQAAGVSNFISDQALFEKIQTLMDEMGVSHFQVYSPAEDRALWKNEAVDTGIRARYVEDHLVVFKVLPASPASEAGLKVGDDLVSRDGLKELNPQSVESTSGVYRVARSGHEAEVKITARALIEDMTPRLTVSGTSGVLELGSFRSEFFEAKAWSAITERLHGLRSLVIDIRRNSGGNFVAMLRALSPFFCEPQNVGHLLQTRHANQAESAMWDKTEDEYQIRALDEFRRIDLITYREYGCYRGPVTVLIGPETSSVSEIFADAFLSRPFSRVWGQPSSGDVVLAVWYDLPRMGSGYSVSIPEANYFTPNGAELEGEGVHPQRELYYDLSESLAGRDSWLLRAASARSERGSKSLPPK